MMEERAMPIHRVPPSRRLDKNDKEIAMLRERVDKLEAWITELLALDITTESVPRYEI